MLKIVFMNDVDFLFFITKRSNKASVLLVLDKNWLDQELETYSFSQAPWL